VSSMPVLGGRYRLLNRIGQGGMSVVWRAHDQVLGRIVAVKLLAGDAASAAGLEMIRAEARTAAQLSHPHICQVYDYGESETESGDHAAYIVMELLSGSTLMERLWAGPMPVPEALRICAQVASALAAAHDCGLVHRDVKPANIMMTPTGPKVVDFGISAPAGAPDLPAADGVMQGTPAYLAPERLLAGEVYAASDVYALGLVLYRMVSGKVPWPVETVTQMLAAHQYQEPAPLPAVDGLPEPVADLCQRCLAKDPGDRPTAQEVAEQLAGAVGARVSQGKELVDIEDEVPGPAGAVPAAEAPRREAVILQSIGRRLLAQGMRYGHEPRRHAMPDERHRRRLLVLAAVLVAAVAGVAGGLWVANGPPDRFEPDVAITPDGPSVDSPRTPAGEETPIHPADGPDPGTGEPPDAPGDPGSGTPDPGQGSAPPAPEPEPSASEEPAQPDPDAVEEVVDTPGGTVVVRCERSRASVDPLDLAPGYRVTDRSQGPGVVRAGIVLGSSDTEVRVDVRCRAGQPESTVEVS
jgi:eukaryotic-like serine/threonine-protein kinase